MANYIRPAAGPDTGNWGIKGPFYGPAGHRGTDIGVSYGKVIAPKAGSIVTKQWSSFLGNVLVIDHHDGIFTGYSHLSATNVNIGDNVSQGQQIATSGNTGSSTSGPHLHWTAGPAAEHIFSGTTINPLTLLGGTSSTTSVSLSTEAGTTLQKFAAKYGYAGPVDGQPGTLTWSAVQKGLTDLGVYTGPLDGDPGVNTYKAIQTLAAKTGYTGPVDGDPGDKTWAAFTTYVNGSNSNPISLSTEAGTILQKFAAKYGYTGPLDGQPGTLTWSAIQKGLTYLGVYTGPLDGDPGVNTYKAIQTLAAKTGYTGPVDGDPGDKTWAAFTTYVNGTTPSVPVVVPPVVIVPEVPYFPTDSGWGLHGVDVSSHQDPATVDYVAMKASGVNFVIIKTAGLNVKPLYVADDLDAHLTKARAAGMLVGFYYVPDGNSNITEQADFFIDTLKTRIKEGDIVVLDNESLDSGVYLSPEQALQFLNIIKEKMGITPFFYTYANLLRLLDWSNIKNAGYPYWGAAYNSNDGTTAGGGITMKYWDSPTIWQYTSQGKVKGYDKVIDRNIAKADTFTKYGYKLPVTPTVPPVTPLPEVPVDRLPEFLIALEGLINSFK